MMDISSLLFFFFFSFRERLFDGVLDGVLLA